MQTCTDYLTCYNPFPISHSPPFPFVLCLEGFFKVMQVAGVIDKEVNGVKIYLYFLSL